MFGDTGRAHALNEAFALDVTMPLSKLRDGTGPPLPGLLCNVFNGHLSGLQVVGCIVAISAVGDFVNARFISKRKNRGS